MGRPEHGWPMSMSLATWRPGEPTSVFSTRGNRIFSTRYCKSGLESEESCLWIVAKPSRSEEAKNALKDAVPALDRYLADSR